MRDMARLRALLGYPDVFDGCRTSGSYGRATNSDLDGLNQMELRLERARLMRVLDLLAQPRFEDPRIPAVTGASPFGPTVSEWAMGRVRRIDLIIGRG